jgi:hypothetical protein
MSLLTLQEIALLKYVESVYHFQPPEKPADYQKLIRNILKKLGFWVEENLICRVAEYCVIQCDHCGKRYKQNPYYVCSYKRRRTKMYGNRSSYKMAYGPGVRSGDFFCSKDCIRKEMYTNTETVRTLDVTRRIFFDMYDRKLNNNYLINSAARTV